MGDTPSALRQQRVKPNPYLTDERKARYTVKRLIRDLTKLCDLVRAGRATAQVHPNSLTVTIQRETKQITIEFFVHTGMVTRIIEVSFEARKKKKKTRRLSPVIYWTALLPTELGRHWSDINFRRSA